MTRGYKTTIWVLACVFASSVALVAAPEPSSSAYQGIVDRNVFDIHPPAADAGNHPAAPPIQIPKLTLNGITTILGKKLAILTTPATKPGASAESLMLAEGQAQNEVEVREIDEKAGSVKVVNHGEEQTLDFDHDGARPAPPTPTLGSIPTSPPPIAIPPPGQGVNVIRPLRTLPSRTVSPFSPNRNPFGVPPAAPQAAQ